MEEAEDACLQKKHGTDQARSEREELASFLTHRSMEGKASVREVCHKGRYRQGCELPGTQSPQDGSEAAPDLHKAKAADATGAIPTAEASGVEAEANSQADNSERSWDCSRDDVERTAVRFANIRHTGGERAVAGGFEGLPIPEVATVLATMAPVYCLVAEKGTSWEQTLALAAGTVQMLSVRTNVNGVSAPGRLGEERANANSVQKLMGPMVVTMAPDAEIWTVD